ncbi:MAG: 30S ribosomal protein S5 [Patescibacteria group bacterium]|nr:30S ribosomal protein S5 [Patescibacteria group bacterium]
MDKPNDNRAKFNNRRGESSRQTEREFDQAIIDIARVTRVMAGGKRMRFRACVVIGDHNGRVGNAVGKGADVTLAINKAVNKAKKHMINVPIVDETIPHRVDVKVGAAKLLIKPAPIGTGIIAGGAVRTVLDLAGVSNVVAKILGSKNKINNVNATIKALKSLKRVESKAKKADKPAEKKADAK